MPVAAESAVLSPGEYLDWEQAQDVKHEYVDGQVFAMAGASDAHGTVAGNFFALLRSHVRGGPCRAFVADMKVRVAPEGPFFYPDVVVTCDERDRGSEYFKEHPIAVIEVLSDATAAFDRGRKFEAYRRIDTLREYVLVDPERRRVECFRRDEQGRWVLYPFGPEGEVELESLAFRCTFDALYEDVAAAQ